MTYTATISSKRQITIPAPLYRHLGLSQGDKLVVSVDKEGLKLVSPTQLLDELEGSLSVPAKYQGMDLDELIRQAKADYFKTRRG